MSKKNNNDESENYELKKEYEAYKTLQAWVKTVPDTIKELEEKGETDKLIKYKKQVKLVLQKLENIKFALEKEIYPNFFIFVLWMYPICFYFLC